MENQQIQEGVVKQLNNKWSLKTKFYLVVLVIIIGLVGYFYYWYKTNNDLRIKSQEVIEMAEKYESLQSSIVNELNNCKDFITKEKGDFGSFEYCKKFIQWVDSIN